MARAILKLDVFLTPSFGVEALAVGLAHDCHEYASAEDIGSGITCPSGGFRCPFGGDEVNCNNITAADWLHVLEVEE